MRSVTTFPRGYQALRIDIDRDQQDSSGDSEVEVLFRWFITRKVNPDTWDYRVKVLAAALRLFGDNFADWAKLQMRGNPYVYEHNYEFLRDTYAYLVSGERKLQVQSWEELLMEYPKAVVLNTLQDRFNDDMDKLLVSKKTIDVLQRWCSIEGGFEDLVYSLHILFGTAKHPRREKA